LSDLPVTHGITHPKQFLDSYLPEWFREFILPSDLLPIVLEVQGVVRAAAVFVSYCG